MSQIVQAKSPVLAVITDKIRYVKARGQADELVKAHGFSVFDMPMVIQAMTNHPEVRGAIRPDWIDTITGEYHGQRDGGRSYEVWHSVGSLATANGLATEFPKAGEYSFMKVGDDEWVAVGKGNYNDQTIARVNLEDLRKGNVPATGTPYTVFVQLDKDNPTINNRVQLGYDQFMKDDRVLMIVGSPNNRVALAKMLFGSKEEGGEGRTSIGSYHKINEVSFDAKAKGRLVFLNGGYGGLSGYNYIDIDGRFGGGSAGGAVRVTAPHDIRQATLEETLAVNRQS